MRLAAVVASVGVLFIACSGSPPVPCTDCSGKCVDLQVDSVNCGACGKACLKGSICTSGACKESCPNAETSCSGKCVDTSNDARNCGVCGNNCGEGKLCAASTCADTCPDTQQACSGKCADVQVDPLNCGMCGKACAAGQLCSNGACGASCAAPTVACNGKCVNTTYDPANCGGCGMACAPTGVAAAVCANSACAYNKCSAGFSDCDNNPINGCELATGNDVNNCGGCAVVCLPQNVQTRPVLQGDGGVADGGASKSDAGAPCGPAPDGGSLGVCGAPLGAFCSVSTCNYEQCQPGYGDCDGLTANGCEANLNTSLTHCGGCNQRCAGPDGVCVAGTCYVDRPSYHFPVGGTPSANDPSYFTAGRPRPITLTFSAIPPAKLYYTTNGAEPLTDGGNATTSATGFFKLPNVGDIYVRWFAVYGDGRREKSIQTYQQNVGPAPIEFGALAENLSWGGTGGNALIVVDGGTPISFQAVIQDWHAQPGAPYCPGCIIVGGLGLDAVGRLDCEGPVGAVYPGISSSPVINTTAPANPGAYYVHYGVGTVYMCTELGGATGGEAIGVVIVK